MEIGVVITITVDGIIVEDDELKKAVLDARSKMCNVLNSGWIDKYNNLLGEIGLDSIDYPVYQDCYICLTNQYWTNLLHANGYRNLRIIDEVLIPLKGYSDYYNCCISLETV